MTVVKSREYYWTNPAAAAPIDYYLDCGLGEGFVHSCSVCPLLQSILLYLLFSHCTRRANTRSRTYAYTVNSISSINSNRDGDSLAHWLTLRSPIVYSRSYCWHGDGQIHNIYVLKYWSADVTAYARAHSIPVFYLAHSFLWCIPEKAITLITHPAGEYSSNFIFRRWYFIG